MSHAIFNLAPSKIFFEIAQAEFWNMAQITLIVAIEIIYCFVSVGSIS